MEYSIMLTPYMLNLVDRNPSLEEMLRGVADLIVGKMVDDISDATKDKQMIVSTFQQVEGAYEISILVVFRPHDGVKVFFGTEVEICELEDDVVASTKTGNE